MNNRPQNNGRRRGRSNNSGGPRQSGGGQSRNYDQGNRIDSRARGNATQLLEKYRNMARDAQLSGDRVMTEYYLQFADHYFRVLSDARVRQEDQRARGDERDDGNQAENEGDDQAEELDAIDMIGRAPRNPENRNPENRNRDERPRQENQTQREPRDNESRGRGRFDHRSDNGRGDGPNGNREAEGVRGPREQPERNGGEESADVQRPRAPRRERNGNGRSNHHDEDTSFGIDVAVLPPAIGIEPARAVPATASDDGEADAAPKRRGRPRKAVSEGESAEG